MGKPLTERAIAAAKPRASRYYLREGRGFALQILPSGSKAFVYLFELRKSKGYILLGHYPICSLADARILYNEAHNLVKKGIDPRDTKKATLEQNELAAKEAAREAQAAKDLSRYDFKTLLNEGIPENFIPATVEQLAATWLISYSRENHSTRWQETALSCIKLHVLPALGKTAISDVRHKHALALIQKIAATTPGSARNVMKFCRQMFKYAMRQEWAEVQPFLEITESVPKIAQKSKDRTLDDAEIVQAWNEVSNSASSLVVKRALKLILVTAQRPGEVAQMHRDQIEGRWWTVPGSIAKNGREHRIYLTDQAMEIVGEQKGYIFPSSKAGKTHVWTNSISRAINRGYETEGKQVGARKIKTTKAPYFGMKPWSPHDLRRTARTNMARLGILDEIGEEVINHAKKGILEFYNKYRYDKEKKMALEKWSEFLREVLNGKEIATEHH